MTDTLIAFAVALWGNDLVKAVIVLLVANIIMGLAASLYSRTFALASVADWLITRAIPYVFGGAVMSMMSYALPGQFGPAVANATWAFVIAALVGHVLDAFRVMGVPIPDVLTDRPKVVQATRIHRAVFHSPRLESE